MSFIILIFKNLKAFFKFNKKMTYVVILSMVLCNLVVLYFSNMYFIDVEKSSKKETEENQVHIMFDYDALSQTNVKSTLEQCDFVDSFEVSSQIKTDRINFQLVAYSDDRSFEQRQILAGIPFDCLQTERFWCSEKFNHNFNVAYNTMITLDKKINFNDKSLTCAGIIATNDFDILTSINDFDEMDIDNMKLVYRFDRDTSQIEIDEFNNFIIEEYSPIGIIRPERSYNYSFFSFLEDMSAIVLFLAIAVLNYLFIFSYMLSKRKKTFAIEKMLGLTSVKIFLISLIEYVIFILIASLISSVLYAPFLWLDNNLVHKVNFYVYTNALIFTANLIMYILVITRYIVRTPSEWYRVGENI